jgi:hypothetical protein
MKTKFRRVVPDNVRVEDLTPLNITCGSTKCNENLHCFSLTKTALKRFGKTHVCTECGKNLIDWERFQKNNIRDANFIFNSLRFELIRHIFWHTEIEAAAIKKAIKLGREQLRNHAYKILKSNIGKYNSIWDGRQTSKGGNEIVHYAQHATATCCRKCLEAWHNIPKDGNLDPEQLDFCTDLVMLYIDERIPDLNNEPLV